MSFDGRAYARDDDGYEQARRDAIWNGRKPDRFPDLIVVAGSENDAVEAVKLAKKEGYRIGIRSGGHSFTATGVRDGGLLLDLSQLDSIEVDKATKTAWIGPAVRAQQLGTVLREHDLTFPYGGCPTVGLGGYMISGGYGFNGKSLGSAASNILAFDVVTADGELIRADAEQNSDFLWAARGGGYGFFGAITRFQIQLHDAPGLITESQFTFSVEDDYDDVATWFMRAAKEEFDPALMTLMFGHKNPDNPAQNVVSIFAITFTDTRKEADRILEPVTNAPITQKAVFTEIGTEVDLDEVWAGIDLLYPEGHRYISDTMWIEDPLADGFVAATRPAFATLPSPGSHVMVNPWIPEQLDGALSGTTTLPFHIYAVTDDSGDDARMVDWVQSVAEPVLPYSNGVGKVNDSDLMIRDQKVLADESAEHLERLRAKHDPEGRFHALLSPSA